MVSGSGSRMEGVSGTHILSARVRKTIQSIKEIVGNHSDADIYVALKETNMDPNETTQKLLNQDPFHEVKRRRDRKKEPQLQNVENKSSAVQPEPQRHSGNVGQGMKFHAHSERNVRRANYSRNTLPGNGREFRVVRDDRVNHIYKEVKPPTLQCSTPANEQSNANTSEKGSSTAATNQKPSGARNSSQVLNNPSDSHARYSKDAVSNVSDKRSASEGKQGMILDAAARVQSIKPNSSQQNSTTVASTSSAVGVYSSSTDPVHVPSPDSRASGVVGAIRLEIGVVGVRRQSSDNDKVKQSSLPSNSYTSSLIGKAGTLENSFQPGGAPSMTEQFSQTNVNEPSFPSKTVSRPSMNNQYNSRPHQHVGHQRVSQHKEWRPKSSKKSSNNNPGVIRTPKKAASSTAKNSKDTESNTAELQDKISQVNIYENQNVIIAQHIRVPETDRCRLTFGTIGAELDSLRHQSEYQLTGAAEKSNEESTTSLTAPAPELSTDDVSGSNQVDLQDDNVRSTGPISPASDVPAEQQLPANKDSSSPQNLDNYANIGLVRHNISSYAPSESHQQDSRDMPGFSGLSSHAANNIAVSAMPMVLQQQPPVEQMYPQVHVSHYANVMPYRQFLSPVFVPPMGMPGYSSNHPYAHPTNGGSYVLMPGGGSHLNANSLKYGVQQFKPVPAGNPTGFGNYANPTGYTMISPGVVGGATALEDSSRVKYKDNLYVPNPQAETSEIWLQNPREIPSMQSTPYYNMQGHAAHAAYMPTHNAAAQSSHMQFAGMYHAPPHPAAIHGPHHLGPAMGNNVGVGVAAAAPGAPLGAYQQPQMGHLNWTTNF
ncbi:PREDICTED: GBF-interacting protein 1-like [Lupinus angustifolius]|uniref:GBF-interacting protein 1-like n=1 Tax=Lupinus angustifolius TaxID=3871 RepID=UPI00092E3EDB|nr:PREDICTED: GBF-interacting protein 1-like [Lupinus angustifolius]